MAFTTSLQLNQVLLDEGLVRKLRQWYLIYLSCWLGSFLLVLLGLLIKTEGIMLLGVFLFFGALVPYIVSMVYAYKVQANLKAAGFIKSGAWQIIVAGLLLNPLMLGFYVPLSVLLAAGKARKKSSEAILR